MTIQLSHPTGIIKSVIQLPASKSLSNRALIIQELADKTIDLKNLSSAHDTLLLRRLLTGTEAILDCEDAGTALRFLTACMTLKEREIIITGSERMKQRPVGELVSALNAIGAKVSFRGKTGYPPLKIEKSIPSGGVLNLDGSISSQFVSALLMIAPRLEKGLEIFLTGEVVSRPYIRMTLSLMEKFGIKSGYNGNHIRIEPQPYHPVSYTCEPDWSAASYWYEVAALSAHADITLPGLNLESLQGDAVIAMLMKQFGVETLQNKNGIRILMDRPARPAFFENSFADFPDLAQTMACTCAGLQVKADLKGLQSLRIKETNRVEALQRELYKLSVQTDFCDYSKLKIYRNRPMKVTSRILHTHNDHRMAMALAPLALKLPFVQMENPEVVSKSYPGYWDDFENAGFIIKSLN